MRCKDVEWVDVSRVVPHQVAVVKAASSLLCRWIQGICLTVVIVVVYMQGAAKSICTQLNNWQLSLRTLCEIWNTPVIKLMQLYHVVSNFRTIFAYTTVIILTSHMSEMTNISSIVAFDGIVQTCHYCCETHVGWQIRRMV